MKVEQAVFGEVRGGHALRLASDRGKIPPDLTSRLDLPDTSPAGAEWSPYLSGFPFGDRYVVARTFSDPAATRTGMVLSHAVITPLDELAATADLRPLLGLLIVGPKVPETLEAREVAASSERPPAAIDLVSAAEALTTRGEGPLVRIGNQGFSDLVVSLWFHFWPELRIAFAFRLSFGPQDLIEEPKPSLVCTPTTLASRWTGHRIVANMAPKTISRAAAVLSGGTEADPVLRFAREIGARLDRLVDLPLLDRAYEHGTAPSPTFGECVTALRIVERLSPDSGAGEAGKRRLIERLTSRLAVATVDGIVLLRNLQAEPFRTADSLWAGMRERIANYQFAENEDKAWLSAIDDSMAATGAIPEWRKALLAGIGEAACTTSSRLPAAFWRWSDAQPSTLISLTDHLPTDPAVEKRLVEAAPRSLPQPAGNAVMTLAVGKGWVKLHGAAAGAALAPHDAIRRQLAIDTDPASLDGLRTALLRASPKQKRDIALEISEERLIRIAAEEVARKPGLLNDVDFRDTSVQQVWAYALTVNADAWKGPADPQGAFTIVLKMLIDGQAVNLDLLAELSASPVADLSDFPRRADVWSRVGSTTLHNLLKATASGWLHRARSAGVPFAPDRALEAVLLADIEFERTLHEVQIGAALQIVSALSFYDESRFLQWLTDLANSRPALASADAEALGRLLLERRWQRSVDQVVLSVRTGRDDLKPALRICHSMVGWVTRWWLGVSPVSSEDKWLVLEELATDLYPHGPDDHELWDRSGGRQADLKNYGTGAARWRDALRQIRQGKKPRAIRLLAEMCRDYPGNDQLRSLASETYFGRDQV